MRLTCPNCGAQYEVPDQVIPLDGRDVQCSNCGNTWFQAHPDTPHSEAALDDPDWDVRDAHDDPVNEPEDAPLSDEANGAPDRGPQPEPTETFADDEYEMDDDVDPDPAESPPERHMPPSISDSSLAEVLREEADREARLRAAEQASGLESQPDLGLEQPKDDAGRRAAEARARMARLRGEDDHGPADPDPIPDTESRRGLLPDIEEINSSLKSSDKAVAPVAYTGESAQVQAPPRRRFSRGFVIALLIAVLALLVYNNAPRISAALPAADPALNAYVAGVDSARLWLDQKMRALTPKQ